MKRRRRSFSPEIDRSFIPFCLTRIHQLQFGHYPTAEMLVWNMGRGGVEAFGIFYCIISHYCVSTVQLFCSLWLSWFSGMAAARPVMCWILSFHRWLMSDGKTNCCFLGRLHLSVNNRTWKCDAGLSHGAGKITSYNCSSEENHFKLNTYRKKRSFKADELLLPRERNHKIFNTRPSLQS